MKIFVLCLILFFLRCGFMEAMILNERSVPDERSAKELKELVSHCGQEIPTIVGLLMYQESLYTAINSFKTGMIHVNELLSRLHLLDDCICNLVGKFGSKYESSTKRIKESLAPIFNYPNNNVHLRNLMQSNCFEPSVIRIMACAIFLNEYLTIRNSCLSLEEHLSQIFSEHIIQQQKNGAEKKEKKATDLITKAECGYNKNLPDQVFLISLHNICRTLEFQQICHEVIRLRLSVLKNLVSAFENYKQVLERTDLIDRATPVSELPVTKGGWKMKPFKTVEGHYLGYCQSILWRDHTKFAALEAMGKLYLNCPNEEVQQLADMALAKSRVDLRMHEYVLLAGLFEDVKGREPSVEALTKVHQYVVKTNSQQLLGEIQFFPHPLFNFVIQNEHETKILNETITLGPKIDSLKSNCLVAERFCEDFTKHRELFCKNYWRLKKTLWSLAQKCPDSHLAQDKNYLARCKLDDYSLRFSKGLLSSRELDFLLKCIKEHTQEINTVTTSQETNGSMFVNERRTAESKPLQGNKIRGKNKRNRRKKGQSVAEPEQSAPNYDLESPSARKGPQSIFLLDKKIAKKIIDEKNNMVVFVYRLQETDVAAVKIINYDERVCLWFSNPKAALVQKQFADSDPRKTNSEAFHSFSKEIDKYALKWGFRKKALNKEGKEVTEILLPGHIDRNGIRYQGLFVYVIDSKYLCYHRFFNECDWRNKLADEWEVELED